MSSRRVTWLSPADPPNAFPDVEQALVEPDGLLAAGGDLNSSRLLAAYTAGIFPWYEEGQPILWWSPDPRCVLHPGELHISRRLAQQIRGTSLTLSFNHAFPDVVQACAGPRRSQQGTWITHDLMQAFTDLQAQGWAHSVEVWDDELLVGGLYGLCIGKVFFGESMFSAVPNASKIALVGLTRHMSTVGMDLVDCQVVSPHLLTLGAIQIARQEFTAILNGACDPPLMHDDWPVAPLKVAEFLTK